MEVNLYCYLSAPGLDKRSAREYLEAFLTDINAPLQATAQAFCIAWEHSPLAPEPNVLRHSFVGAATLLLPFSFQYFSLEQTTLRVSLLKTLLQNLVYKQGIEVQFEYHLDE